MSSVRSEFRGCELYEGDTPQTLHPGLPPFDSVEGAQMAASGEAIVGELIPGPRSSGVPTNALRDLDIVQPTRGEPVFIPLMTGLSSRSPGWGSTERMPPQGQDASQRRILELEQAIRYMVDNPSDAPVIAARVLG